MALIHLPNHLSPFQLLIINTTCWSDAEMNETIICKHNMNIVKCESVSIISQHVYFSLSICVKP